MSIDIDRLESVLELAGEARRLQWELEASQAREKVLRDELRVIAARPANDPNRANWDAIALEHIEIAEHALTISTDDTALRQAIRAAKEEMRERCAKVCEDLVTPTRLGGNPGRAWITGTFDCAEAIRSLEVE